jgi:ferredoxin-thioredoxin reductase catalytic subunit
VLPLHMHSQECHCMLFLTEDNGFVGQDQNITMEVRLHMR